MRLYEIIFMQFLGLMENIHLNSNYCHTYPFMLAGVMVSYNLKY